MTLLNSLLPSSSLPSFPSRNAFTHSLSFPLQVSSPAWPPSLFPFLNVPFSPVSLPPSLPFPPLDTPYHFTLPVPLPIISAPQVACVPYWSPSMLNLSSLVPLPGDGSREITKVNSPFLPSYDHPLLHPPFPRLRSLPLLSDNSSHQSVPRLLLFFPRLFTLHVTIFHATSSSLHCHSSHLPTLLDPPFLPLTARRQSPSYVYHSFLLPFKFFNTFYSEHFPLPSFFFFLLPTFPPVLFSSSPKGSS